MRVWPVLALVGVLHFATPAALEACSCASATVPEYIEWADAIFSARVLWRTVEPNADGWLWYTHMVGVDKVWKGDARKVEYLMTGMGGGDCGQPLVPGDEYLFFVNGDRPEGGLVVGDPLPTRAGWGFGICGATSRMGGDFANSLIAEMGEAKWTVVDPARFDNLERVDLHSYAKAQEKAVWDLRRGKGDSFVQAGSALGKGVPWLAAGLLIGWALARVGRRHKTPNPESRDAD